MMMMMMMMIMMIMMIMQCVIYGSCMKEGRYEYDGCLCGMPVI